MEVDSSVKAKWSRGHDMGKEKELVNTTQSSFTAPMKSLRKDRCKANLELVHLKLLLVLLSGIDVIVRRESLLPQLMSRQRGVEAQGGAARARNIRQQESQIERTTK